MKYQTQLGGSPAKITYIIMLLLTYFAGVGTTSHPSLCARNPLRTLEPLQYCTVQR